MTSGFTRFFKSFFVLYNIMSMYVLFFLLQERLSSHLRVQRYGVFLILQIFWQLFLKFFWGKYLMLWKSEVREREFFLYFLERKIECNYWRLKVAKKSCSILQKQLLLFIAYFCNYITPWSSIACATFIKPAMLAPFT